TVPPDREFPPLHELDFVCQFGILVTICFEQRFPFLPRTLAACSDARREMFVNSIRHKKLFILGPSVAAFHEPSLFIAKRLTMTWCGVLLIGGAIADVTMQHDKCRPAFRLSEDVEGLFDAFDIVGVSDSQYVPSVSEEASRDVLSKRQLRVS